MYFFDLTETAAIRRECTPLDTSLSPCGRGRAMHSLKAALMPGRFAFLAFVIFAILGGASGAVFCSRFSGGTPAVVPVGPVRVKELPCPEGGCPGFTLPLEVQAVMNADSSSQAMQHGTNPGSPGPDLPPKMAVPSHVMVTQMEEVEDHQPEMLSLTELGHDMVMPMKQMENHQPPIIAPQPNLGVKDGGVGSDPGDDYVVGGKPARQGEFPYLAAIMSAGRFRCGGTILTPGAVLTARHCCFDISSTQDFYPMEIFEVRAGDFDLTADEGTEQVRKPKKCELVGRPSRTEAASVYSDDYAIFLLTEPFKRAQHVGPVSLPPAGVSIPAGTKCTVVGWGSTKVERPRNADHRSTTNIPYKAVVPILPDERCKVAYPIRFARPSQLCAGFEEGGVDACKGDSGGPLMCRHANGQLHQFGIVSWGDGCAYPNHYGVYANVSHVRDWIKRIAGV